MTQAAQVRTASVGVSAVTATDQCHNTRDTRVLKSEPTRVATVTMKTVPVTNEDDDGKGNTGKNE